MTNESKRQWVHLGAVVFALLIPWLSKWETLGLAAGAVLFNVLVLPKVAPQLFRESENTRSFFKGILAYPVTIFLIVLLCPWNKKELAAGAWAVLACGDSFSNLIGRTFTSDKLPWNRDKSWAGFIAFMITAFIGCWFFVWWVNRGIGWHTIAIASAITAVISGIVETLDIELDDNFSVGLSALLVLYLYSRFFILENETGR